MLINKIIIFLLGLAMVLAAKDIVPWKWKDGIDIPLTKKQFFFLDV